MKYLLLLALSISLFSCSKKAAAEHEVRILEQKATNLKQEISKLKSDVVHINDLISIKTDSVSEDFKTYVMMIEVKQSRTLDILDTENYIKDQMNKFSFPIQVSKQFYNNHNVGDELKSDFRIGSFIMNGTMSSWKIKVKEKKIAY